jgi:methylenetetrahydrofolate reductase (NADPH)
MPIHTYGGFTRMTAMCKTFVPKYIMDEFEPVKVTSLSSSPLAPNAHFYLFYQDNDEEVKKVGVRLCVDMCRKLVSNGVPFLHFYTLNLEQSVTNILSGLGIINKETLYR